MIKLDEDKINISTAKLAKSKGFNVEEPCTCGGFPECICNIVRGENHLYICTQSLLQKWLREIHGIEVIIDLDITLSYVYKIQSLHSKASYVGTTIISKYVYSTHSEALKAGLYRALVLI